MTAVSLITLHWIHHGAEQTNRYDEYKIPDYQLLHNIEEDQEYLICFFQMQHFIHNNCHIESCIGLPNLV